MRFVPSAGADLPIFVVAFLVAAAIAYALTPFVRTSAVRLGIVDRPEHRRVNTHPVARGGGIAIVVAFLVVAIEIGRAHV